MRYDLCDVLDLVQQTYPDRKYTSAICKNVFMASGKVELIGGDRDLFFIEKINLSVSAAYVALADIPFAMCRDNLGELVLVYTSSLIGDGSDSFVTTKIFEPDIFCEKFELRFGAGVQCGAVVRVWSLVP